MSADRPYTTNSFELPRVEHALAQRELQAYSFAGELGHIAAATPFHHGIEAIARDRFALIKAETWQRFAIGVQECHACFAAAGIYVQMQFATAELQWLRDQFRRHRSA